jgi:hypothetical protein
LFQFCEVPLLAADCEALVSSLKSYLVAASVPGPRLSQLE